jgi:hypothetical protein
VCTESYMHWGYSKDTGPTCCGYGVNLLQFPSLLKSFLHKERILIYENVCGVCPQFLLWNIITILPSEALYFSGVFIDLHSVTATFVVTGYPCGTLQLPLDKFS